MIHNIIQEIRNRLKAKSKPSTDESIYQELMEQVQDNSVIRSCNNCIYHNALLCAVNPKRPLNFFAPNNCSDWKVNNDRY